MAIIDTLRLARALHDRGGFSQEAADATAEALNAALGEDVATKTDIEGLKVATKASIDRLDSKLDASIDRLESKLDASVTRLDGRITHVDSKLTVLMWAVGINAAATITILVRHW
jgi:hypothetical protein